METSKPSDNVGAMFLVNLSLSIMASFDRRALIKVIKLKVFNPDWKKLALRSN